MYYRRRISNATLSGEHAHLCKRQVTWQESHDAEHWQPMSGTILVVGRDQALYVDVQGVHYWIFADPQRYKDIVIQESE
jgi:hypothetical protein